MSDSSGSEDLVQFLTQQGYSADQIDKICKKVAEYDHRTMSDSAFDSIDKGTLNLDSIIREALDEPESA